MSPVAAAVIVWSLTVVMVVVLVRERGAGRTRYFSRARGYLDQALTNFFEKTYEQIPVVNKEFVRQFFHYSIHLILSGVLKITRYMERMLREIVRLNKKKATAGLEKKETHLDKIAAHKQESALSEPEKKKRKEKALRGEVSRPHELQQ